MDAVTPPSDRPAPSSRRLLGLVGPPGVGKSTVAARLVAEADEPAFAVPMDGFHLADVTLRERGTLARKGAPETFDPRGYAALLARLRTEEHEVFAPGFDRGLEQPLAGALTVGPQVRLVVAEGNYLLLDTPEWRVVRAQLDEVWFLHLDDTLRRERLVARHVRYGKTPAQAAAWVEAVDEPNALLVLACRDRADRVVEVD